MRGVVVCFTWLAATALPRGRVAVKDRKVVRSGADLYLTQRLDHFDRSVGGTFEQRYWVNASHFRKDGGPVFLCVGGEGPPLDASVLSRSVHCSDAVELAEEAGALLVALEHRYYGASVPATAERGAKRLRHLSSQQAIGDLAAFVPFCTEKFDLTPGKNKWVAFGGSYPGLVAGYARLKLPHLFHAAVSSSSPWRATVDMTEYNDVVADALAYEEIGGSRACLDAVTAGHEAIRAILESTPAARAALAARFNFCARGALEDEATRRAWAGNGVVKIPAQENDPFSDTVNASIGTVCEVLLRDGAPPYVDALAALDGLQRGGACVDAKQLTAPLPADDGTDALSWYWQTCAEYGFYQTCEKISRCPFARGYATLADAAAFCGDAFGVDASSVAANVAFTNAFYGSDAPAGTRILFPNGDVDPWSGLGVRDAPSPDEPVLLVKGASHHAWTHPADEIHQPAVARAKAEIQAQVRVWLLED